MWGARAKNRALQLLATYDAAEMISGVVTLNSDSVGDPARFRPLHELVSGLDALKAAPRRTGTVGLVVSRREGGRRETLARHSLTVDGGLEGDAWGRREGRNPDAQITVMELAVAGLIANGQPLALFGDNLFLDLSAGNLGTGSRVRIGRALLEVTPKRHKGCRKFSSRFGEDAFRFVVQPDRRYRNLRGIYMRIVEEGDIEPGDAVEAI